MKNTGTFLKLLSFLCLLALLGGCSTKPAAQPSA